jgi:hypothetical protein
MSLRKSPRQAAPAHETVRRAPTPDRANTEQEPMAAAQAVELKGLAAETLEPDAFDPSLTAAEAAERIKALKAKLRLMSEPPHTA